MPEIEECLEILKRHIWEKQQIEKVHLTECAGRVLAQDITAEHMVPAFPRSAMDGYAVRALELLEASKEKPVTLKVTGTLMAGDYEEIVYQPKTAVRVMTGAYVPKGYDAVVKQEDTDYGETRVQVYKPVGVYENYCPIGEDIKMGELVIRKDTRLTSAHVGILASLGIEWVSVYETARIAILSTGSEIMEVGQPLPNGRIYNSISYMLAADIKKEGLQVVSMQTCADEEVLLAEKIREAVQKADFVITTGAVSVGKKDIIPQVLEKLGAVTLFRRANIQPGTPTMASVLEDTVILSLSGNPYAALANFEVYFWPAMAKLMHHASFDTKMGTVMLADAYPKTNKHRRLIRAYADHGKVYLPVQNHASSVIWNMTKCNCFIDLEAGRSVEIGDEVMVRYFHGRY